ncbi:hypothetical protein BASA82_000814 [Batrachochytrium salamandrivorans]|nr:hypothetical protein BASA82_000814 [Batrachochytrium salamandrivorans]
MEWVSKRLGIVHTGPKSLTTAHTTDNEKHPPDGRNIGSFAENSRTSSVRNAFKIISAEFVLTNKTEVDQTTNMTAFLTRIVDLFNECAMKDIINSATCTSEIRSLISLASKSLSSAFTSNSFDAPSNSDIIQVVNQREIIRINLRIFELLSSTEHGDTIKLIISSGASRDVQILLWVLSHITKSILDTQLGPGYWDTNEPIFREISKSIGEFIRILTRMPDASREINVSVLFQVMWSSSPEVSDSSNIWLKCAQNSITAVCQSKVLTKETCSWLKTSNQIEIALNRISHCMDLSKPEISSSLFFTLTAILKASYRNSPELLEDFETLGGYEIASKLILASASSKYLEIENVVLRCIEELSYVGISKDDEFSAGDGEIPFQHVDFRMPVSGQDLVFCNPACLKTYCHIFMSSQTDTGNHLSQEELGRVHTATASVLFDIIKANPINYFMISRSNIILCFVEGLNSVETVTQDIIIDILRYVVLNLNYVPFKELALLFVHLQGSSSATTVQTVSEFCCSLLVESRRLKDVFRELGLVNMFSSLFSELVKRYPSYQDNSLIESQSSFERHTFVIDVPLISSFMHLMRILQLLIQNYENIQLFQSKSRDSLFELIKYKPLRDGVFLILEELLCGKFNITSTGPSTTGERHELQGAIESLCTYARDDAQLKMDIMEIINKALSKSEAMQDGFRTSGGFETLMTVLMSISTHTQTPESTRSIRKVTDDSQESSRDPLRLWFETFILAMRNCSKNRQYVEKTLDRALLMETLMNHFINEEKDIRLVFGGLLGIAYESFKCIEYFEANTFNDAPFQSMHDSISNFFQATPVLLLRNAHFVTLVAQMLPSIPQSNKCLVLTIIEALHVTSMSCRHNQVLLCSYGILQTIFGWLFDRQTCWFISQFPHEPLGIVYDCQTSGLDLAALTKRTGSVLVSIAKRLLEIGISDSELQYLLSRVDIRSKQRATEKQTILFEFLLHGLRYGRSPYYLHFDESLSNSTPFLTIPDYNRSFPPISGYTFLAWIRVEKFDLLRNIEIVSIFDMDDKERLNIYIEGTKSRHLVVRTIKSTCRFENTVFREREWTHIALVHQKPRITASTIDLYINGKLVENAKCGYLGHPGSVSKVQTFIGNRSSGPKSMDIECHSIWDLGPTYFIEEVQLSASEISTIYDTRFNCVANWQSYLSKYQNSETSTRSTDVSQIQGETSPISSISFVLSPTKLHSETLDIPEDKILFALCANNSVEKIIGSHSNETNSSLATIASRIIPTKNAIFNSATPKPSADNGIDPLCAYVHGDVLVVCTNRMVDGIWKLGGCAVLLKLIDISTTSDSLYQSVSVLIESLEYSWRNAAEMEKCHFYEILSHLMKAKRDLVTIAIMDVLLIVVGRTLENSETCMLTNNQALRHLFLDVELWRTTPELQRYYLTQMTDFIVHSCNRSRNIQKLNEMAIIKRILLMLKSQIIPIELLPDLVNHLKIFLKAGWSSDNIKWVCTYLMYTLPKEDDYSEIRDLSAKLKSKVGSMGFEDSPILIVSSKSLQHHSYSVHARNAILEMLFEILSEKSDSSANFVLEFSKVSSSRWIILFCGPRLDTYTVTIACRIFARLWILHDITAPSKFKEGCLIMSRLLQPYSNVLQIYPSLLAILCGLDIAIVPLDMQYDVSTLMAIMKPLGTKARRNISPDIMRVISSLLTQTVRSLSQWSDKLDSLNQSSPGKNLKASLAHKLFDDDENENENDIHQDDDFSKSFNCDIERANSRLECFSEVVQTTLQFIGTMYRYLEDMKDSVCRQESIDDIVGMLFKLVSTGTILTLEKELSTKEDPSVLDNLSIETIFSTSHGIDINDSAIKLKLMFIEVDPIGAPHSIRKCQTSVLESGESMFAISCRNQNAMTDPRDSALLTPVQASRHVFTLCTTSTENMATTTRNIIDALIELVLTITLESILGTWKPVQGLEMVLKAIPPSGKMHQMHFQSFLLLCTMNAVYSKVFKRKTYLSDTRVLANVGKFITLLVDKTYQGVFTDGPENVFDYILAVVDIIHTVAEENAAKVLRTDFNHLPGFFKQVNRITAFYFGYISLQDDKDGALLSKFLGKILFYQKTVIGPRNSDSEAFKVNTHHLFLCLLNSNDSVKSKAIEIWKVLLLHKPAHVSALLRTPKASTDYKDLIDGFSKILEPDSSAFLLWLTSKRQEITSLFQESSTRAWDQFCQNEVRATRDSAKAAQKARYSKLKRHYKRIALESDVFVKYLAKSKSWVQDVQKIEQDRFQRFKQDYVVMLASIEAEWITLSGSLYLERAIWGPEKNDQTRWKLDFTEAKGRMRKKMRQNNDVYVHYQSKFEKIQLSSKTQKFPEIEHPLVICQVQDIDFVSPSEAKMFDDVLISPDNDSAMRTSAPDISAIEDSNEPSLGLDVDLELNLTEKEEIVTGERPTLNVQLSSENLLASEKDLLEPENDWEEVVVEEDQNRKILRLLEPGDEIVETINCARLVGLELCEGLCIVCQDNIYLVDNYFQRPDGEIVNIEDVPHEERNIYHWIVTGSKRHDNDTGVTEILTDEEKHMCRKCSFDDIKEVHKRLYLFRNVALEIFIGDGRNFLLTFWSIRARDAVYNRMISKASLDTSESVSGIGPQSGQSVIQNAIFGGSPLAELTQKWCSREISNFAYLMHLNTMAGRSYNDLTQYPVFPWIISDYESKEIDLSNPAVYRDLSKPMGGQGAMRAAEFVDRFNTWDDPNIPGCHYGTHYSSSMIVCSYLIRLEPFTQQYLKLQGGHFDHPDRLFHSLAISWASASRLNTTDVRELIPEFFYLPDFLINTNKFKFGVKQTGEVIDNVFLPPWAKNDASLFIQTNREALESEYVSAHLHEWVDLIFGYKQQGEEAAQNINVFHYLSYGGAVDIDKIADTVEKQATIGIIHNFGQTPQQLFKKPHPRRASDVIQNQAISDIWMSAGSDKLMAVGACKLFIPPTCNRYIEWDYLDNSLRLCQSDNGKTLGVFENLHIGHVSCAAISDQKLLVTGGSDMNKVLSIALSRSYSIIVRGGEDCICIIWDMNRQQYIRTLFGHQGPISSICIHEGVGDILTCCETLLRLWNVNGELMLSKSISLTFLDPVMSCAFYEGRPSESFDSSIIFTGHKKGHVKIWSKSFVDWSSEQGDGEPAYKWDLKCIKTLEPHTSPSAVTLIRTPSSGRLLLIGDVSGRVTSWMMPDGSGTELHYAHEDACMSCNMKFSVLERKGNCRCCGGSFCLPCMATITDRGYRMCHTCYGKVRALAIMNSTSSKPTIVTTPLSAPALALSSPVHVASPSSP